MKRRLAAGIAAVATVAGLGIAAPAHAWTGKPGKYMFPNGRYLYAQIWLGTGQNFGYQTSTQFLGCCGGPAKANSITNTASISVTGVGVSLGNASGGTASDKDFSTTWTNYNAIISDRAGTNSVSSLFYLYIIGRSDGSANIPYYGSPRTVASSVKKW